MGLRTKQKYEVVVLTAKPMPTIYATLSRIFEKAGAVLVYKETLGCKQLHYTIEKKRSHTQRSLLLFCALPKCERLVRVRIFVKFKKLHLKIYHNSRRCVTRGLYYE